MLKLLLAVSLFVFSSFPKGLLKIPAIQVVEPIYDAPLVNQEWNPEDWSGRVANLGGTAWMVDARGLPEDRFTITLVSHAEGPLRDIPRLQAGDMIYLYNGVWEMQYTVDVIEIVSWRDLWPVMPTDLPTLTLMICWGEEYRYIVRASRTKVIDQWTGEEYDSQS